MAVAEREAILLDLIDKDALWRLTDIDSCDTCCTPRQPQYVKDYSTCFDCGQLQKKHGGALADLVPITYTTSEWRLGKALRIFKDRCRSNPDHLLAKRMAAVWSAFMENQTTRIAPTWGFDIITTVPSSNPTVLACLQRAEREDWWVPETTTGFASSAPSFPRQRARTGTQRLDMAGKWTVDEGAVLGQDVLVLDDITTTGSTLHSFARALRNAGAESVRAVVLACNLGRDGPWILPYLKQQRADGLVWTPHENKHDIIT